MSSKRIFHTSRLKYLLIYLIVIFLLILSFIVYKENSFKIYSIVLSLILIILAEMWSRGTDLIIEEDHLTSEVGILSKKIMRIHYFDISDVMVGQSFIQRILGIGNLHINSSGGSGQKEIVLKKIQKVKLIHEIITKKIHRYKKLK